MGFCLCLVGLIWFFQGIKLLPGSFMTGQPFWTMAGALTFFAGVGIIRAGRLFFPGPRSGKQ